MYKLQLEAVFLGAGVLAVVTCARWLVLVRFPARSYLAHAPPLLQGVGEVSGRPVVRLVVSGEFSPADLLVGERQR